jgi:hypothetical protein
MTRVFHPYYSMTIAPPIAVLAGAGVADAWRSWRTGSRGWWLLPVGIGATALWSAVLLGRTPGYVAWLGPAVGVSALIVCAAMVWGRIRPQWQAPLRLATAVLALFACLAGPSAYALSSIGRDYSGGDPKAGPANAAMPVGGNPSDRGAGYPPHRPGGGYGLPADRPGVVAGEYPPRPGQVGPPPGETVDPGPGPVADGGGGGPEQVTVDAGLIAYLFANHDGETWIVATVGTRVAARIILETGGAAMAMGGFSGGDPTPTGEELAEYIATGEVRFVLLEQGRRIDRWAGVVEQRCSPVDGVTTPGQILYDCAAGARGPRDGVTPVP